jgi:hypothetical protein
MPDRFKNKDVFKSRLGKRYFTNVIYPEIPVSQDDTYIITAGGDRYDTLAQQFYGDSSLWWVIASANVSKTDGLATTPGVQLRIPADAASVRRLFDDVNSER